MRVCVCVGNIQSSETGFGNNSIRTRQPFKNEHLNFPGKDLNVTDITDIYNIYIYI